MCTNTTYVSILNKVIENFTNLTSEEVEKLTALRDFIAKWNATKSDKPTKS